MDSSVIFLALSGLWLLYLMPGWLSRRHQAKQTRVEDRFSDGMRTLTPRREGRDERPSGARRGALLHDGAHISTTGSQPLSTKVSEKEGPRRRPPAVLGLAFLFSLVAFPVLAGLALFGVAGWTLAATPLVTAGLSLLSLRWFARRPLSAAAGVKTPAAVPARPGTVRTTAVDTTVDDAQRGLSETVLYDEGAILAVERAAAVAAARADAQQKEAALAELKANLKPGEWLPVEVPTPTYLLKPNAPRRPARPSEIDIREGESLDVREIDLRESLPWLDEHAPLRRVAGE